MGWSARDIPDLSGKTFVVTGANSGIGLEAAEVLAGRGGHVVMACRTPAKAESAADRIRRRHPKARVEVRSLDLSSLDSVRRFAEALEKDHPAIDVLVNNAGVMALPRALTADGFEMQIGTNHLGHFALTGLLLPSLARASAPRVVTVSSAVHQGGRVDLDDLMGERRYDKWGAYMQSKLANLLFTFELARRFEKAHPHAISLACHPGYAATNLRGVGPRLEKSWTAAIFDAGNALFAQSAASGALPTLRAATDPAAKSGEYYGPRGPLGLWGAPVAQRTAARARDLEVARALWKRSAELTKVRYLDAT